MITAEMKSDYYQGFLDEVSRSFAFCIRELREPLRSQVALAYLLCRILDTNEDAHFTDRWQQLRLMNEFGGFLIKPPSRQKVALWLDQMPLSRLESARPSASRVAVCQSRTSLIEPVGLQLPVEGS